MSKLNTMLASLQGSIVERMIASSGRYQPGLLDSMIKRSINRNITHMPRGVIAPNIVQVTLDQEAFDRFAPVRDILANELAASLTSYCENNKLTLKAPVEIRFDTSMELESGRVGIDAQISEMHG